ncbi:XRE family transcriptional regulator [Actinoplanes regularis]|uniref:XRE family transcriptional regulator n=2 Tax=Actinoplanes regularis TaxID=52697 RepID=UPI0011777242|nr:XRE family transcriptional regulator [Actinoplanes regularis]
MADLDPAVALARWAEFVNRALRSVRPALSDRKIYELSGISTSTLSRWRNAKGTQLPEIDRVKVFCRVVGASLTEAMAVLGMTDDDPQATPEAPLPPDVQIILRKLADPSTPEADRDFIRQSLEMLADRARSVGKTKPASQAH